MKLNRPVNAVTLGGWLALSCPDLVRSRIVHRLTMGRVPFDAQLLVAMIERWESEYGEEPPPEHWIGNALATAELITQLMDHAPMTDKDKALATNLTKTALFASGVMTA